MENVRVYCENTQAYESVAMGTTLYELCQKIGCGQVLAALVDNKLKSLDYKVINPHNIRFIDYDHPDGRRTYIRSLCFVLQKVVREMFPDKVLISYLLGVTVVSALAVSVQHLGTHSNTTATFPVDNAGHILAM